MLRSTMSRENNTSTNVGAPDATPLFSGVFRPAFSIFRVIILRNRPVSHVDYGAKRSGREKNDRRPRKIRARTTLFREWLELQRIPVNEFNFVYEVL